MRRWKQVLQETDAYDLMLLGVVLLSIVLVLGFYGLRALLTAQISP